MAHDISRALRSSEELVRVAADLSETPREGVAALALALGRICAAERLSLDGAIALIHLAADGEDARAVISPRAGARTRDVLDS